jgi:hypothetical protein
MLDGGPLDEASRPTVRNATLPRAFGACVFLESISPNHAKRIWDHKHTALDLPGSSARLTIHS